MKHSASTQLWVGSPEHLSGQVVALIQKEYCPQQACGYCAICKQIVAEQHYAYLTVSTTKSAYARADLETIFSKIAFQGSSEEPRFCVITQAEKLSAACANSLLKLLEEPPAGWHWLLLTDRPQELLPTVISRCMVKEYASERDGGTRELYSFLTTLPLGDIVHFQQILERAKLSDYDSRLLFDELLAFWTKKPQAQANWIECLHSFLNYQPMPGSSKFFWRTIYLNMHCLLAKES